MKVQVNKINNQNKKNNQSFGRVELQNYQEMWWIALSKWEPDTVNVDGFTRFHSKKAETVSNKLAELGEQIKAPEHFKKIKETLLEIVDEVKAKYPLFKEEDAETIRKALNAKNPEIQVKHYDAIIGDF